MHARASNLRREFLTLGISSVGLQEFLKQQNTRKKANVSASEVAWNERRGYLCLICSYISPTWSCLSHRGGGCRSRSHQILNGGLCIRGSNSGLSWQWWSARVAKGANFTPCTTGRAKHVPWNKMWLAPLGTVWRFVCGFRSCAFRLCSFVRLFFLQEGRNTL